MPIQFDVVVLGGGVAGGAAAIAAAQSGARVCTVSERPGATALFSGAWRGDCPGGLRHALELAGYELRECPQALPHPTGSLVACDLTHRPHEAAQLPDSAVVIGIAGLPGFDAGSLARQWGARSGIELDAAVITLARTPAAGWAPASLAAEIERSPDFLASPLSDMLERRGAARAIVPAVLGITNEARTHQLVADATGMMIGEALGTPPSLPGWRLHNALRSALARARVTVLESRATLSRQTDGRIDAVELASGDVIEAPVYVLATGKYVAGGIEANGSFCEPALGCPVWIDHLGERFTAVEPLILTDPDRSEDQPLLRAGVHTDAQQRPVNTLGDVVYSNVLVAGSIRAGWSITTACIGDVAIDGWTAGTRAVTA